MNTPTLTDVELTLLGIISEGPRYGGELERLIAARGLRDWLMVGSSSLYYILSKLEEQALIQSWQNGTGRDQQAFQITEAGRGVLQTAVMDLLGRRRGLDGFSLGLANLHVLRPSQALRALTSQQQDLETAITRLQTMEAALPDETALATRAMIAHQITIMRAEQSWLNDFIVTWRKAHPTMRETDETAPIPVVPDRAAAPTIVHRRTEAHHNKQVQSIKRPRSDQGGTSE